MYKRQSAISEAMNQMMGSAATSLSSMLNKMIDISPPEADVIDLTETVDEKSIDSFLSGQFVKISFRMEIGDLVDSQIMQLYPFSFAREMCSSISKNMEMDVNANATLENNSNTASAASQPTAAPRQEQPMTAQQMGQPMMGQQTMSQQPVMSQPVNVQPAQFQTFTQGMSPVLQSENIDLIMDVPLDVTVELGRTSKSCLLYTSEMSNVDLSTEFTQMIITQRGFQSNSRVITTSDTLLEELINLKR